MILPGGRTVQPSRHPVQSSNYVHSNPTGAAVKARIWQHVDQTIEMAPWEFATVQQQVVWK